MNPFDDLSARRRLWANVLDGLWSATSIVPFRWLQGPVIRCERVMVPWLIQRAFLESRLRAVRVYVRNSSRKPEEMNVFADDLDISIEIPAEEALRAEEFLRAAERAKKLLPCIGETLVVTSPEERLLEELMSSHGDLIRFVKNVQKLVWNRERHRGYGHRYHRRKSERAVRRVLSGLIGGRFPEPDFDQPLRSIVSDSVRRNLWMALGLGTDWTPEARSHGVALCRYWEVAYGTDGAYPGDLLEVSSEVMAVLQAVLPSGAVSLSSEVLALRKSEPFQSAYRALSQYFAMELRQGVRMRFKDESDAERLLEGIGAERGALVEVRHAHPDHERNVVINWAVSSVCNYRCGYCWDANHDGRNKFPSEERLQAVLAFIEKAVRHYEGRKVCFEFAGGEPTLWPALPDVMSYASGLGADVRLISNGSGTLEMWERLRPLLSGGVLLSYHSESADDDRFIEKVELLRRSVSVHVNVMMNPRRFEQCVDFARKLSAIPDVMYTVHPVFVDSSKPQYRYSLEQEERLRSPEGIAPPPRMTKPQRTYRGLMKAVYSDSSSRTVNTEKLLLEGLNQWRGWQCEIGRELLMVTVDGQVIDGWCSSARRHGYFWDPGLRLPDQGVVCRDRSCNDMCGLMVAKTKRP